MRFAPRNASTKKRTARRAAIGQVEVLESRALLAASVTGVTWPSLSGDIQRADQGVNTAPAAIRTMEQALQDEITNGPLASLNSGSITASAFQTEVASLVSDFQGNVNGQLSARFPNVAQIIDLQGTKVETVLNALTTQQADGLITGSALSSQAATAVNGLTGGPLRALGTPSSAIVDATNTFESQLNLLPPTLASGATPSLTVAQVQAIGTADTKAYIAAMNASLYVHPTVNQQIDAAATTLETAVNALGQGTTDPATALTQAIQTFDAAVLGTNGVFGAGGIGKRALGG